ncbi:MAG: helix-turn-helix domain-containing protein [Ruminococcaceae bacterium]|nr:helix-turn-helix domain-containing protein [Oscillospiraceae bacterium]
MNATYPSCGRKNSRYHFNHVFLDQALLCDRFYLYQIGERFCNDKEEILPHKQFCAEITFVISGKGVISTNGEKTTVGKNDCYFSFQDDVHAVSSDGESALRYFFCGFKAADPKAAELLSSLKSRMQEMGRQHVNLPEIAPLFHSQLSELQNKRSYSDENIGLLLYRMLIMIYRALRKNDVDRDGYQSTDKSVLAYKIMAHIDENVFTMKKLRELESVFYFKYRYLEKCFTAITGNTISDYFRMVRMQHAAKLLAKDQSITEIAEKLNFSSIYAFSRAFTNYYGCSPSEYRRREDGKTEQ